MHREYRPRQPRSRYLQPRQQSPHQHRAQGVQRQVDSVITSGIFSKRQPLRPKGKRRKREIRVEPNRQRPLLSVHQRIVASHQPPVIHQKTPRQQRPVGGQHQARQQQRAENGAPTAAPPRLPAALVFVSARHVSSLRDDGHRVESQSGNCEDHLLSGFLKCHRQRIVPLR